MRKLFVVAALACLSSASLAHAGSYSDALAKCVIERTTDADRMSFVVWTFEAMSTHPAVKSLTNITQGQRDASTKQAAELMQRLMTVDCHTQFAYVLRFEGLDAVQKAFEQLGETAMEGLMTDPSVNQAMESLTKYIDRSKFEAVGKEAAGLKAAPDASH